MEFVNTFWALVPAIVAIVLRSSRRKPTVRFSSASWSARCCSRDSTPSAPSTPSSADRSSPKAAPRKTQSSRDSCHRWPIARASSSSW